jgi:diguanylate cyclase (GGDEF)-like protein
MRVLVADDDLVTRRLLTAALTKWGYDVTAADDGDDAWQVMQAVDAPRLAILDWMMPGMNGTDLCRRLRSREAEEYTYILLLTGKNTKQDIVDGLDSGADDYLTKPFDTQELKVRLRTGHRLLDLMGQLVAAREDLRVQATCDSLTGLHNRFAILDSLTRELTRAKRESIPLSVVMADIDHFKQINDNYGHPIGDLVLRTVAQSLRATIRPYDSVGRYGGEEFLVVVPGCSVDCAASQADRLRAAVAQMAIETPAGPIHPTMSFGVAVSTIERQLHEVDLIRIADAALYRAKRAGRNCVELGNPSELGRDAVLPDDRFVTISLPTSVSPKAEARCG